MAVHGGRSQGTSSALRRAHAGAQEGRQHARAVNRLVALAVLAATAVWEPVRPGVWQRESRMASGGALDAVAFNAGQFRTSGSWGWVVRDGVEMQPPGSGSVAMAFVVDSNGVPSLVEQSEVPARRGHVRLAFQSYPALLVGNGSLPWELQESRRGVDLVHRDSRLALGIRDDGSVVVALTRFTGLGRGAGEMLPWGPTVPEMAAYMRSLGCRRAVLLDGGVSGQLMVRSEDGVLHRWPNWREVPLGLVVKPL